MSDEPIPMILTCPSCGARHIDAGEFASKPHHTHACQCCGMAWRPAIAPTVGVRFLPGFKDEVPAPATNIVAVDIRKLSDEALRARYREMRGWLISCLRGNNGSLDEDALLHTIWPEDSDDYRRGLLSDGEHIDIGKPCGIANDVVRVLDSVKSGGLTAQQAIDSLENEADAGGWRE